LGLEVALGFLITWAVKKVSRVGKRAAQIVDDALDAAMDRVHEVVVGKLGGDPALARLELEASESGQVSDRTRTRVQLALEEAVDEDPQFAEALQAAVDSAPVNAAERGVVVSGDNSGIVSTGDKTINTQHR
jgi:hypothetical protein